MVLTQQETETAIQQAWRIGRLRFKLDSYQKEVYDKIYRSNPEEPFLQICSRGWGKTFEDCTIAIETARRQFEPCNVLIISATLKKLRILVKPAFEEILQDCPAEYQPRFNREDSCYEFPNGVRIHLLAAEGKHIQDARGIHKVVLVIIDEAAFFGDEEDSYPLDHVIDSILTPMFLRTKSKPRLIISTTPPEIPGHPVKQYFEHASSVGCAVTMDIFHSSIAPEKREEMRRRCKDDIAWRREYLCEWVVDTERLIIPEWNDKWTEVPPRDQYFPFYHKYGFLDTGVRDFTFNGLGYYDFKRALAVVDDEVLLKGDQVRTDILAREVKAKEAIHYGGKMHRRVADNNNLIIIQDLAGPLHGLSYVPTTKDDLFAMVNEVRLWVSSGRLRVNPRCTYLIGCLRNGVWDKNKKEFARSSTYGHYDGLAALCYWLRNIDEHTNPVPITFGTHPDTHHIPPGVEEPANYKALREAFKITKGRATTADWRQRR